MNELVKFFEDLSTDERGGFIVLGVILAGILFFVSGYATGEILRKITVG